MTTTDFELKRAISDIQSQLASLDWRLRTAAPDPHPGRAFFAMAALELHRLLGDGVEAGKAERLVQRATTNPAMTGVTNWASELVQSPVGGMLLAIRKASAYAGLASRTVAFTVDAEMPKAVVGGECAASFVGEAQPIGISKSSLAPLTLTPKKLACLVTLSEELLSYGTNVDATLRTLMGVGVANALDAAFFSTSAATSSTPSGILNGVTPLTTSAATPPAAAMAADLTALIGALNSPVDPVLIVGAPRSLYMSTVLSPGFSVPVLTSAALPAARVIAVDAAGLVCGHDVTPRFAASRNAALHEDSTALPLGTPGSPAVVAAPMRSLYQTDAVAIRCTLNVCWAVRSGSVSYVDASW